MSEADTSTASRATTFSFDDRANELRIVVIDDDRISLSVVTGQLRESGFINVVGYTDPLDGLRDIEADPLCVVLVDLLMPDITGLQIIQQLKAKERTASIPVLMLTASGSHSNRTKALRLGVTDFLTKPCDPVELTARTRNAATIRLYHDRLARRARRLESEVRSRTKLLTLTRRQVVECLARAGEFRDNDTGRHVLRVGRYSTIIAEAMCCDRNFIESIELAAQLHDVGKIGIPDAILLKPDKLTEEEFDLMKQHAVRGSRVFEQMSPSEMQRVQRHTELGADIIGDTGFDLLELARQISLTHHERWDGTGYPLGLAGEDIPLAGRIVAVADVFDALSSRRPYKPAIPREHCFEIMNEQRYRHFDGQVLDAFLGCVPQIIEVQIDLADPT
ncbi:MAG: response regulator [Planctomycetes bacterium]|nr:response regulator [Planctomycetota bacterium]